MFHNCVIFVIVKKGKSHASTHKKKKRKEHDVLPASRPLRENINFVANINTSEAKHGVYLRMCCAPVQDKFQVPVPRSLWCASAHVLCICSRQVSGVQTSVRCQHQDLYGRTGCVTCACVVYLFQTNVRCQHQDLCGITGCVTCACAVYLFQTSISGRTGCVTYACAVYLFQTSVRCQHQDL